MEAEEFVTSKLEEFPHDRDGHREEDNEETTEEFRRFFGFIIIKRVVANDRSADAGEKMNELVENKVCPTNIEIEADAEIERNKNKEIIHDFDAIGDIFEIEDFLYEQWRERQKEARDDAADLAISWIKNKAEAEINGQ